MSIIGDALRSTASQVFEAGKERFKDTARTSREIAGDEHLREYMHDHFVNAATTKIAERSPILANLATMLTESHRHRRDIDRHVNEQYKDVPNYKESVRNILKEGAGLTGKRLEEYKKEHHEIYHMFDKHREGRQFGKGALHAKFESILKGKSAYRDFDAPEPTESSTGTSASSTDADMSAVVKNTADTVTAIKSLGRMLGAEQASTKAQVVTKSGTFGAKDALLSQLVLGKVSTLTPTKRQNATSILRGATSRVFSSTGTIVPSTNGGRTSASRELQDTVNATIKPTQQSEISPKSGESSSLMETLGLGVLATKAGSIASAASKFALHALGVAAAGAGGYMLGSKVVNPLINSFMETFGSYDNEKIANAPVTLPGVTPARAALELNQRVSTLNAAQTASASKQDSQPIIISSPTSIANVGGGGNSGGGSSFLSVRNYESSFSKVQMQDYWSKTV